MDVRPRAAIRSAARAQPAIAGAGQRAGTVDPAGAGLSRRRLPRVERCVAAAGRHRPTYRSDAVAGQLRPLSQSNGVQLADARESREPSHDPVPFCRREWRSPGTSLGAARPDRQCGQSEPGESGGTVFAEPRRSRHQVTCATRARRRRGTRGHSPLLAGDERRPELPLRPDVVELHRADARRLRRIPHCRHGRGPVRHAGLSAGAGGCAASGQRPLALESRRLSPPLLERRPRRDKAPRRRLDVSWVPDPPATPRTLYWRGGNPGSNAEVRLSAAIGERLRRRRACGRVGRDRHPRQVDLQRGRVVRVALADEPCRVRSTAVRDTRPRRSSP